MREKAKALGLLAAALLAFAFMLLIAFGAVDADALTEAVAAVLAAAGLVWSWWRNNNVTEEAQEAQRYLDDLKGAR